MIEVKFRNMEQKKKEAIATVASDEANMRPLVVHDPNYFKTCMCVCI